MSSQFIPTKQKEAAAAPAVLERSGIVSIIRLDDAEAVSRIARALYQGGVRCFEIPLTADNAPQMIVQLIRQLPADAAVGAGTALTAEAARQVIAAGASFLVSPHFVPDVAGVCRTHGVAYIPGALTPQEIYHAWEAGAAIVKVFSIRAFGAQYLSDLAGPYPHIKLMPTGGISLGNAAQFIKAGACAITIGRDIIGQGPWDEAALGRITARAEKLVADIRQARQT